MPKHYINSIVNVKSFYSFMKVDLTRATFNIPQLINLLTVAIAEYGFLYQPTIIS